MRESYVKRAKDGRDHFTLTISHVYYFKHASCTTIKYCIAERLNFRELSIAYAIRGPVVPAKRWIIILRLVCFIHPHFTSAPPYFCLLSFYIIS